MNFLFSTTFSVYVGDGSRALFNLPLMDTFFIYLRIGFYIC